MLARQQRFQLCALLRDLQTVEAEADEELVGVIGRLHLDAHDRVGVAGFRLADIGETPDRRTLLVWLVQGYEKGFFPRASYRHKRDDLLWMQVAVYGSPSHRPFAEEHGGSLLAQHPHSHAGPSPVPLITKQTPPVSPRHACAQSRRGLDPVHKEAVCRPPLPLVLHPARGPVGLGELGAFPVEIRAVRELSAEAVEHVVERVALRHFAGTPEGVIAMLPRVDDEVLREARVVIPAHGATQRIELPAIRRLRQNVRASDVKQVLVRQHQGPLCLRFQIGMAAHGGELHLRVEGVTVNRGRPQPVATVYDDGVGADAAHRPAHNRGALVFVVRGAPFRVKQTAGSEEHHHGIADVSTANLPPVQERRDAVVPILGRLRRAQHRYAALREKGGRGGRGLASRHAFQPAEKQIIPVRFVRFGQQREEPTVLPVFGVCPAQSPEGAGINRAPIAPGIVYQEDVSRLLAPTGRGVAPVRHADSSFPQPHLFNGVCRCDYAVEESLDRRAGGAFELVKISALVTPHDVSDVGQDQSENP